MISGLLMFLGSAVFLGGKAFSSSIAKSELSAHQNRTGVNSERQLKIGLMLTSKDEVDQRMVYDLLKSVDPNKTDMPKYFKGIKEKILGEMDQFFEWKEKGYLDSYKGMSSVIKMQDIEYTVWLISRQEGWTYEHQKPYIIPPSLCPGYEFAKDSYAMNLAKRL